MADAVNRTEYNLTCTLFHDDIGKEVRVYGIAVQSGGCGYRVEGISDENTLIEELISRLSSGDVDPTILPELVEDFIVEKYGMFRKIS